MVNKGWAFSELMNMKIPTLFKYSEETVKLHNEQNKTEN